MATVKYLDENGLSTVWSKVKGIVTPKADKVSGATAGHLAGLNSGGNLVDSGLAADNIAQKDGSYSGMTVGAAEDLVSAESVASEFTSRITGGSTAVGKGGTALLDKIKGRTLVWNQLLSKAYTSVNATISVSDGVVTMLATAQNGYAATSVSMVYTAGHKYYTSVELRGESAAPVKIQTAGSPDYNNGNAVTLSTTWQRFSWIPIRGASSVSVTSYPRVVDTRSSGWDNIYIRNTMVCDLTLMFGAGNEPSTAAEFEALYPGPYYDYNPGTLISNAATAIETVGWNIWDEEWEGGAYNDGVKVSDNSCIRSKNYIKVLPDTEYYYKFPKTGRISYFDDAKTFISSETVLNNTKTTPANCYYITFHVSQTTTYANDICINLSDPSRNGTYEPYWRSELELGLGDIKVKSHNIWDEEVESGYIVPTSGEAVADATRIRMKNYIPVLPNTTYYGLSSNPFWKVYYDANKNYISYGSNSNGTFTTPANAAFIRCGFEAYYGSTYKYDTIINLSDPAFNGRYEPYGDGGVISITGGLKSAGTVYDEISGGKLVKRIGSADMGALDWTYGSSQLRFVSAGLVGKIKSPDINDAGNAISTRFQSVSYSYLGLDRSFCVIFTGSNAAGQLWLYDSAYTGADTFKAAMSGVPLYYELAQPIEYELAEAIPTAMRNDPYGTERRLPEDTAAIVTAPFRADITYSTNIKEAVQSLPQNYININSMQDFLAALGALMGGTWTLRPADGKFDFTFTPNPSNE